MGKEIEELKLLLSNCFKNIDKIDNLADLYQVEIYVKEYIRRYIILNEERIKSKTKKEEGS